MSSDSNHAVHLPPYDRDEYDRQITKYYETINATLPLPRVEERLQAFSKLLLGVKYLRDACGEGLEGYYDQSPLYRTDAFDCMTYVNFVVALAISNHLTEFQQTLLRINYADDQPSFISRHHFYEMDWCGYNHRKGYVQDVTEKVVDRQGTAIAATAMTIIDKANWFRHLPADRLRFLQSLSQEASQHRLDELHRESRHFTAAKNHFSYLPLSRLFNKEGQALHEYFDQIPSGSIVAVVRPDWPIEEKIGTRMNVSHVGFALRTQGGGLIYREASTVYRRVVDIPLSEYLQSYLQSDTIKGINIQVLV